MDKIQKDINEALETGRRFNILKMFSVAPLFSFMIILGTYYPINLFRMASEAGHDPAVPLTSMVTQLTSVEKGLIPPPIASLVFYSCFVGFVIFVFISSLKETVLRPIY